VTIKVDTSEARAALDGMGEAVSPAGLAEVAEALTAAFGEAAARAFAQKVDPATGRPWAPASPLTAGSRSYKSLLVRTGALEESVTAETHKGPHSAFARVGLDASERSVLVRGLVHFYGVTARKRRSNRTARVRPQQSMPARRFVGLSSRDLSEFLAEAERAIAKAGS